VLFINEDFHIITRQTFSDGVITKIGVVRGQLGFSKKILVEIYKIGDIIYQ
jgi:hypothetical protein